MRFFIITFFIFMNSIAGNAQVTAPGAKLHLIDSNFLFAEGPAADKNGNIFFTDQPANNIWKYNTAGVLSLFMHGTRRSNGMYADAEGNLVSCADENNELVLISPRKHITVLAHNYNGHILNGPNDVWVNRQSGGMYITDPYFQRPYWKRDKPDSTLGGEKLYYLPPGKNELLMADSSMKKPNGIVGTPDGQYLYVADMGEWKTYRYTIAPDGTLQNKQLFAEEGSDGMTIDNRGNVYLTGKGVTVYDSSGNKIEHIDVPEDWTGNICFGGKRKNLLFITASKSVYSIEMLVKGVE